MSTIDALITEVQTSPRGRKIAAFFDFDGTLIDGYSALAMMQHRARTRDLSPLEAARLMLVGLEAVVGIADFERFMRVGVQAFRGREASDLAELGQRLLLTALGGSLYPDAWRLVTAHQERGHRMVIASSALPFQVEPLAHEIGIEDVLCTRLAETDGVLNGEIDGPILWGTGKADAVEQFAVREGIDLSRSFAYGNGTEDLEFLERVGRPRPVNATAELERAAVDHGWPVSQFTPTPGRPGLTTVARTFGAYGGMLASFGAGLGVGLLNRSRRDAVNLTMGMGSDVALALAGIRLNVTGEEHLWSHRPAVFIFNHQSILDGFVVMKLLREDVTGVAKKEVAKQPGFGQFARLANMAFVDRGDPGSARQALAPVVERLREGYSIVIAPEGTRSATPAVGRFKKGAFHMAMQGDVPIVPIVIRNAGELLWRGSTFMRSGTLDVAVQAPISVSNWKTHELNERVAEVRQLFVSTMARWPTAVLGPGAPGEQTPTSPKRSTGPREPVG
jgi:HAD superfamily hydrolase (TIGR01490 family)